MLQHPESPTRIANRHACWEILEVVVQASNLSCSACNQQPNLKQCLHPSLLCILTRAAIDGLTTTHFHCWERGRKDPASKALSHYKKPVYIWAAITFLCILSNPFILPKSKCSFGNNIETLMLLCIHMCISQRCRIVPFDHYPQV